MDFCCKSIAFAYGMTAWTFWVLVNLGTTGQGTSWRENRPTPLYENQTSQYMGSAFSTLYPEELCGTKYHSCCSVVREHERRITGLGQALESLQRSIKKVLCLVACILCSLMYHSKILQLYWDVTISARIGFLI